MNKQHSSQLMGSQRRLPGGLSSGQAIVIVAAAAVALVAIIGLSVDGGRLLLLRRDEQNAGDAATLAATLALCSGGTESQIITAGESAAAANGYTDGTNNTTVLIDPEPDASEVPADTCLNCAVLVQIDRGIEPYFIQIVYSGQLKATTKSVGTCNPDNVPIDTITLPGGEEVAAPDIGVLWTGGESCEANVQVDDGYLGGNVHSNGTIKFNPSNADGQNCQSAPPAGSNPQGGWVFGNMTYAADPSGNNWDDAKIYECDWGQLPGVDEDPVVCGASCQLPADDLNDNDPEQVPSYVDASGDPIWPAEADYDIADFDVTVPGSIAYNLDAEGKFHTVTDEDDLWTQYNDPVTGGPGVYYINGDIDLKKNDPNVPATDVEMTLVATGQVSFHLEHNFKGWYPQSAAETHRLSIFANGDGPTPSCIAKDIHVSSTDGIFTGIIFAPYGEAKFSTSSTESQSGCVIGYQTSISSSGASIICDPGENNDQGSINLSQ